MRLALLTTDNREYFRDFENPVPYFGTAPEALLQGFAVLPEIEVHVVCCAQRKLHAPEKLAPNIWFHSLHVPKIGWLRTGYQGCIRAARKCLQKVRPEIVHGQGTERDCAISAVFSGFPNVITVHGNMRLVAQVTASPPFSYNWFMGQLEKITLPRSDGIVCITRYTRQAVADLARRTWLIPNAVDGSFFEISRAEESPPTILCVGNICLRKNQNAFIHALDGLAGRRAFQVILLGSADMADPYNKEFFKLIEKRPWCRYEGFADRAKLKTYMARAALLALPSLEDNCPMVVLEAMAAGLPVAAARVGGVPDLVDEGTTGMLFDPFSASSIRDTVASFLDDPQRAAQLAVAARAQALQRFQPREIALQHLAVYKEVLSNRS
jgi:glycosyltransferase involved in cell wall biosynthesis